MFLKYLDFIFAPFRAINNKILGVKNIKGNIQVDINRAKSLKSRGPECGRDRVGQMNAEAQSAGRAGSNREPKRCSRQAGCRGCPGDAGDAGRTCPGAPNPNPPIRTKGFWIFKKKFCTQCEQQLDKSWDACPFCAQIAAQVVAAPAKPGAQDASVRARLDRAGRAACSCSAGSCRCRAHRRASCSRSRRSRRSAPIRMHGPAERQVHVVEARRDQGRERHVGPPRRRLDERHLRQQPARRSSRARRQRLHQVRQRDAASSSAYEGRPVIDAPARRHLGDGDHRVVVRGLASAHAEGSQVEVFLSVKPPIQGRQVQGRGARRSRRRSSVARRSRRTSSRSPSRRRRRRCSMKASALRPYNAGNETIAVAFVINGQEVWIGNDDIEPEDSPARHLGDPEEPQAGASDGAVRDRGAARQQGRADHLRRQGRGEGPDGTARQHQRRGAGLAEGLLQEVRHRDGRGHQPGASPSSTT